MTNRPLRTTQTRDPGQGWFDTDAAPEPVADLGDLVADAQKPGQYFEFADGCLYEVLLARVGELPRTRVAATLETRDLASLQTSLETLLATLD